MESVYEVIEAKQLPPVEASEKIEYLTKKRDLARKLGLRYQGDMVETEIAYLKKHRVTIPALTKDEVTIWKAFLPTAYRDGMYGEDSLAHYSYDRIPHPVLEHWAACKADNLFESYEIWTPEKPKMVDPVLMGVIGRQYHVIARWAESDANLIDFAGIKRVLKLRWLKNWAGDGADWFKLLAFCFAIAFVPSFIASIAAHDLAWPLFVGLLGVFLTGIAFFMIRDYIKDPVMAACRRA